MKNILSKQRVIRSFLIGLCIFIWGIKVPALLGNSTPLFCYTRDEWGNKTLVKENGAVVVEDTFIMEIPKKEWSENSSTTITITLEDEEGNRKARTIKILKKEP